MKQAEGKQVTVYASFTNKEREQGYNGQTAHLWIPKTMDVPEEQRSPHNRNWSIGRNVVLVSGQPFIHEAEEHSFVEFWVAKITLPMDKVFIDSDEYGVPDGARATDYPEYIHAGALAYGSYMEMASMSDPEVKVEWLDAIMVNWPPYPLALVNSQKVDNWPHGEV